MPNHTKIEHIFRISPLEQLLELKLYFQIIDKTAFSHSKDLLALLILIIVWALAAAGDFFLLITEGIGYCTKVC